MDAGKKDRHQFVREKNIITQNPTFHFRQIAANRRAEDAKARRKYNFMNGINWCSNMSPFHLKVFQVVVYKASVFIFVSFCLERLVCVIVEAQFWHEKFLWCGGGRASPPSLQHAEAEGNLLFYCKRQQLMMMVV